MEGSMNGGGDFLKMGAGLCVLVWGNNLRACTEI